ncbi:HD domain-containing phosphohydrolase [Balneatrix alpica]|uniref:HD domain-containing phosphohydrolase n=1 Tax=Balneatrix alpica TaxID=75684 RepID=A0ABV5Z7C9_9GAMM|nr:HD domain-containing phosphohydrolase [Balneatrix alpica]
MSVWRILCVDDEPSVLSSLKRLLRAGNYEVLTADSGAQGLELLKIHPIQVVISDMRMPGMSGAEFLAQVAQLYPETTRVLLTGYADMESTISAVNHGQIHRYVQKPWNNEELLLALDDIIERQRLRFENAFLLKEVERQNEELKELNASLEQRVRQRTQQLHQSVKKLEKMHEQAQHNYKTTVKTFYNLISINPKLGGMPAVKTSELCKLMALELGLPQQDVNNISLAGLLHQMGLLGATPEVLAKPLSELSKEQQEQYKLHPLRASIALAPADSLAPIALIIRHQYENFDGSGVPDELHEEQIPLGSRILAIARDYFAAMTGKLSPQRASSQGAIDRLHLSAETLYDPDLLKLLPSAVAKLEHDALKNNEILIKVDQLKEGMQLARNLYNHTQMLLLPEGHRFTTATINRVKAQEKSEGVSLALYILE